MGTCSTTSKVPNESNTESNTINKEEKINECEILRKSLPDFGLGKRQEFVKYLTGKMGDMSEEEVRYFVTRCLSYHTNIIDWLSIGSFDEIAGEVRSWMQQREVIELNERKFNF